MNKGTVVYIGETVVVDVNSDRKEIKVTIENIDGDKKDYLVRTNKHNYLDQVRKFERGDYPIGTNFEFFFYKDAVRGTSNIWKIFNVTKPIPKDEKIS